MQVELDEYVQQLQVLKPQLSLKDSQIAELKTITVSARAEAAESKRLLEAERQRLTQENLVLTDQLTGPAHLQNSASRLTLSLETSLLLRESVDKMAAEMALLERERAEQALRVKIAKMREQEVRDLRERTQVERERSCERAAKREGLTIARPLLSGRALARPSRSPSCAPRWRLPLFMCTLSPAHTFSLSSTYLCTRQRTKQQRRCEQLTKKSCK